MKINKPKEISNLDEFSKILIRSTDHPFEGQFILWIIFQLFWKHILSDYVVYCDKICVSKFFSENYVQSMCFYSFN